MHGDKVGMKRGSILSIRHTCFRNPYIHDMTHRFDVAARQCVMYSTFVLRYEKLVGMAATEHDHKGLKDVKLLCHNGRVKRHIP